MIEPLISATIQWTPKGRAQQFGQWVDAYEWSERCDGYSLTRTLHICIAAAFDAKLRDRLSDAARHGTVIHRLTLRCSTESALTLAGLQITHLDVICPAGAVVQRQLRCTFMAVNTERSSTNVAVAA